MGEKETTDYGICLGDTRFTGLDFAGDVAIFAETMEGPCVRAEIGIRVPWTKGLLNQDKYSEICGLIEGNIDMPPPVTV